MNPESEIRKLLEEFMQVQGNLIMSERMFVAFSVLNWAYLKHKNPELLQYYLNEVKKHLRGELTLYWEDGVVKVHRGKK